MFQPTFFSCLILFFTLSFSSLFATDTGWLTGRVVDQESGEPVPNTNLAIQGKNFGIASDKNGYFAIQSLPPGKYVLIASRLGYSPHEMEIEIEAGQTVSLEISLKADPVKFREVVVSATRENALSSEVTVATEVISRDRIERSSAQNIGEVLENTLGLFIKNYGHIGALKTASMRGAGESHVLILLDGQRLNSAQGVAPDLSDIPLHAIERIEVIRGGHSALYGTDAIGGVINLITRSSFNANRPAFGSVSSTFASFGTNIVQTSFGQHSENYHFYVAYNYTESDGDFEFDNAGESVKRTNNELRWNDIFIKFGYTPNLSSNFTGYMQFHDARRGAPGPLSFSSETATQKDRSWKFHLSFDHQFASNFDFNARTFFHKFKQNFDDAEAFFPIQSEHRNDAYGLNLQTDWRLSTTNKITAGYEFREDKINSTDVSKQKRTIHSVFLQDQIRLPLVNNGSTSFRFIPAFRLDKYADAETQISPKAGVLFSHISNFELNLRGNWGRSYRIPSFNDLYWPAGPFTAGNPQLVPEKSFGYDFGFGLNFKKMGYWGLEANYFQTDLENLIIWGPREDGVWTPSNVQDADIKGIETKLSFQTLGDFVDCSINYNYLDAVDGTQNSNTHGKQLIYRPKHKAAFNLTLNLKKVKLHGAHRVVGKRFSSSDNSSSLDSYNLTDVGISLKFPLLSGNAKVRVELRNIFDQEFKVIDGFPTPGREWRTTLGFDF